MIVLRYIALPVTEVCCTIYYKYESAEGKMDLLTTEKKGSSRDASDLQHIFYRALRGSTAA